MPLGSSLAARSGGNGTFKKPSGERTRPVFYFIGAFCLIGWLYVFFTSDLLIVDQIQVSGLKNMDSVDASREVLAALDGRGAWRPWPARHAWFIDKQKLEEDLKTRFFAEKVTVDKSYDHILRLSVEERANKLVLHSHQQYVWVDLQGLVTAELTQTERHAIQARLLGQVFSTLNDPPVIHQNLDENITEGYRVAETSIIKSWIEKASEIQHAGVAYRELEIDGNDQGKIISPEGYPLLVDLSQPLRPQLENYKAFKSSRTYYKVSEYLDVRIPGRIYWK